jgi:DNA-3-methyladenine glycosylase
MFGPPGRAYVYLIYGMYHCLNAVTEPEGTGAAVLIRGVEGVEGPGRLCRAWGIDLAMNGWDLSRSRLRILDGAPVAEGRVVVGPRVGITRAAELPLRFRVSGRLG